MRVRVLTAALLLSATSVVMALSTSCGSPRQEPAMPTADFTPDAVLDVTPRSATWTAREPSVRAEGPNATVPQGSVIEIANTSDETIRVYGDAGRSFDTGQMLPGERTTIALTEKLTAPKTVRVSVAGQNGTLAELIITPAP